MWLKPPKGARALEPAESETQSYGKVDLRDGMTQAGTILGGGRFGSDEFLVRTGTVLLSRSVRQNCAFLGRVVRELTSVRACSTL